MNEKLDVVGFTDHHVLGRSFYAVHLRDNRVLAYSFITSLATRSYRQMDGALKDYRKYDFVDCNGTLLITKKEEAA